MIWKVLFYIELVTVIAGIIIAFFHGMGVAMIAIGTYLAFLTWAKFTHAETEKKLKNIIPWIEHAGDYKLISNSEIANSEMDKLQQKLEEIGFQSLGDYGFGLQKPSLCRIMVHYDQQIWAEIQEKCGISFYSFYVDGTIFRYSNQKKYQTKIRSKKMVFKMFSEDSIQNIYKKIKEDTNNYLLPNHIAIKTADEFIRLLDYISIRQQLHKIRFVIPHITVEALLNYDISSNLAQKMVNIHEMKIGFSQCSNSYEENGENPPSLSKECQRRIASRDESELPDFVYFPKAYESGIIQKKSGVCDCCERMVGYLYNGVIYSIYDVENLCVWCIADGIAALRYSGTFNELEEQISKDTSIIICQQTPTILSWQDIQWATCCDDAMIYIEEIGTKRVLEKYHNNIAFENAISKFEPFPNFDQLYAELPDKGESGWLIHVFQCQHCKKYKLIFDAA
ncbi:CbrC family protein [Lentisphaerota bacterium WC36G]|nr:CbrC family protein [Lentisphaerae bacterium WC36]